MENKKNYMCAICGTAYETIAGRAKCECACIAKQEEKAKKEAEAKKNEEFNARMEEVVKAFEYACELGDKLREDYGVAYSYNPMYRFVKDYPYTLLKHFIVK